MICQQLQNWNTTKTLLCWLCYEDFCSVRENIEVVSFHLEDVKADVTARVASRPCCSVHSVWAVPCVSKKVKRSLSFQNLTFPKGNFLHNPHHFIVSSCPEVSFCIIISIKMAHYCFSIWINQGKISSNGTAFFSLLLSARLSWGTELLCNYKSSEKNPFNTFFYHL